MAHLFAGITAQQFREGRMRPRHRRAQGGHGDACTDAKALGRLGDVLQVTNPVQEGDRHQILQALGHPEADIGGPGDQCGGGVFQIPARQIIGGFRQKCGLCRGERSHRQIAQGSGILRHPDGHRGGFGGFGGADDRRIAGAAAEIARQLVVVIAGAVQMRGGHADHETRGAKAALAAVMRHHLGLHRMQFARRARDRLNGAQCLAMQLWHQHQAGVQRVAAAGIGDHHRAGPAIALITAFLGAGQATAFAQPVEHALCRVAHPHRAGFSVQKKRNIHVVIRRDTRLASPARCGVERGRVQETPSTGV